MPNLTSVYTSTFILFFIHTYRVFLWFLYSFISPFWFNHALSVHRLFCIVFFKSLGTLLHFIYKVLKFFVLSILTFFLAFARNLVSVTHQKLSKINMLTLLFLFTRLCKDVILLLIFEFRSSLADTVSYIITTLLDLFDI